MGDQNSRKQKGGSGTVSENLAVRRHRPGAQAPQEMTVETTDRMVMHTSPTKPVPGAFLTVPQASDFLGFKPTYIRKLCYLKQIPHYKPNGGHLLFDRAELEAFVHAGRISTNEELSEKANNVLNHGARGRA